MKFSTAKILTGLLALHALLLGSFNAHAQIIDTYAGGLQYHDTPALEVALRNPASVAVASNGTVYVAVRDANAVYRLDSVAGTVTQVAGNGRWGFSGDDGQAINASLANPSGVAVDGSGNLYIADQYNSRIRKVTPGGIISTVAGNGSAGYSGDDGQAINARLYYPSGVAVDGSGNLYIADQYNHRIRKVTPGGIISTVAGNGSAGYSGDDGQAINASLYYPSGVAVDGSGNLYIADQYNSRIRKVTPGGIISTVAGNGSAGYSGDDGQAINARLSYPSGVAVDGSGNLYIADQYNHRIRKVTPGGIISTVAGNGSAGYSGDDGQAINARLSYPSGVAVDGSGNLYIADQYNHRIRKVTPGGIISTVAGNGSAGYSGDDGQAINASLYYPSGVAVDGSGNLYIADRSNYRIRKVTPGGIISTVAGNGSAGYSGDDGQAINASLYSPSGVAVDGSGNLYIADRSNYRIRRVTPGGIISTVAGNGSAGYSGDDGQAINASLYSPSGVAVDGSGNLYIADQNNSRIRKVTPGGIISTVAGNGSAGYSGDDGQAINARLAYPSGVAVDGSGNLYIADASNHRIRRVTPGGIISTVAGNGSAGYSGDDGQAINARLAYPSGVAVDGSGNLYIADASNSRIRRVTPGGIISTVAGNGSWGFSGDDGQAINASLAYPYGVAVDDAGRLFIADSNNDRVRRVGAPPADTTPPVITPVVNGTSGANGWYTSAVNLTWTVTDPESTVSASTGCDVTSISTDTAGTSFTCEATSAGGTSSNSVTIRRDATAPTASGTPGTLPNANGWYRNDVTVSFTGSDATSGIASCSSPVVLDAEAPGQIASGTCTDQAGNTSAPANVTGISIDKTPPSVSASRAPLPGGTGWNTSPVTASFSATDDLSGVAPDACTPPLVISTNGADQTATGTCADLAGNVGTTTLTGINIDDAAPVVVATPSPAANADGWNNTAVTVSFSATDSLSGSGVAGCSAPVTLSTEGANQSASGSCSDVAGNSGSATASALNLDLTAPEVSLVVPQDGASYAQDSQVLADFSCSDALSGIQGCTGTVDSGAAIDTATLGAHSFTVSATDVAGNAFTRSSSYTVSAPATPEFTLAPQALAFGAQSVNIASAPQTVSVTNTGLVPVTISSISRAGANPNQFLLTHDCGSSLAVGASCTLTVSFKPAGVGARSASIVVAGGGGAGTHSVALSGTGSTDAYLMELAPGSASFGTQAVNVASAPVPFTLSNTGSVALPVNSITLTGANPSQFSQTNDCGVSVAVGSICTINVLFKPTGVGARSATLTVKAVGGQLTKTASLSGTGIKPKYTLSPASLAFGNQAVGQASAPLQITLTNTGTLALPINRIADSGTNAGQFTETHTCGTSVPAGGSCTINVVFTPAAAGAKSAIVKVQPGGGVAAQSVPVSGTGVAASFAVSPTSLAFGNQPRNTSSAARQVTVNNTGTVPLTISGVTLGGANPAQFSQSNTCSSPLVAGGSCTVSVVFRPTGAGSRTATLQVSGTGGSGSRTVTLGGTGT